jgi:hypothetical protein
MRWQPPAICGVSEMGGQVPHDMKAAQQAVIDAEKHAHALAVAYVDAVNAAINREQSRARAELGPRRAVYTSDRVIIRDDRVASLRRQLQVATVAFNEAEKQYRHAQALALVSA